MILQNILFPTTETCTEDLLYFRLPPGGERYAWGTNCLEIAKGEHVHFDTYFNGFSLEKWLKYTNVKKISVTLRIEGAIRVTLRRKERVFGNVLIDNIGEFICKSKRGQIEEFTLTYESQSALGMYCFSLEGLDKHSCFHGGYYGADVTEKDVRPVKIGLNICTYKRERFVAKNVVALRKNFLENPESYMFDKLEVFISDNAQTLPLADFNTDKVHTVYNKNVGGAGGFTRGMIEISNVREAKKITHILVMDDDVIIEPESIFRTVTFLSVVKEQYKDIFVGGAMLRLDNQYIQTESGAVWNKGSLISLKSGMDLRECEACLYNETEEKAEFSAWWYCAFPVEVVTDKNLPMPIFIRGDDVEYGLRNMKYLALMNGICVWHEPFENKYASSMYYYILRNRLIDNALHDSVMKKEKFIEEMRWQVMREVELYRYKNARLLMRGVEDYFRGVDWLRAADGEKLHKDIMAAGYKLQYIEELDIPFSYPKYEWAMNQPEVNSRKHRLAYKYAINGTLLSPTQEEVIIPTVTARPINVFRAKSVLNYDYASRKGFITERDPEEAKSCIKQLKALCKKTNRLYDKAAADFAENGKRLMNRSFWDNYLGLDAKADKTTAAQPKQKAAANK